MRTPLQQQVDTLPDLVREMIDPLLRAIADSFPETLCQRIERLFIAGCGDSHHAGLNAEMAFEQLAGLPCEPMTAMQFARYAAAALPTAVPASNLLLAVSVSGQVSRTIEALEMGQRAGATAVAVSGNAHSPLAQAADLLLHTTVPPLPHEMQGMVVPGTRSYVASQLALYLTAVHLGQQRRHLSRKQANQLRRTLAAIPDLMEQTVVQTDVVAAETAVAWADAQQFVYCGAGPNLGTALFSAAKLLEASGDIAIAQDSEEWAHLQYFAREVDTPTLFISANGREHSRTQELLTAARTIGRRVALIAPAPLPHAAIHFPVATAPLETFSPLLTCLPGTLFAAYRAQQQQVPYFRDFGGGRSQEGGGGISRIRSSERLTSLPDSL